jgi:uncharacterized protein YbjT (DUF2867 family)
MINNNERTILITGATGTVGSEVVKQLLATSSSSDHNLIRAAVHSKSKADIFSHNNNSNKEVEIVNIDYNKPETVADALNKVDKLFLLTLPAPNIVTDTFTSVVKEAKKNDVKNIVKLSVMGADLEPGTTIGRLHRQEEKIIEESGMPFTFLRPNGFMQNFARAGQIIRNQNAFCLPGGDARVSFVDVRDVAAVAANILLLTRGNGSEQQQHENKSYDLTGPEALSYSRAAEILSTQLGRKISYAAMSEEDARKGMKDAGMEEWYIDAMMEFYNNAVDLYNIDRGEWWSRTTTVVEQITGRKPISFAQFAKDYAEALR